jgi:hypothetical protein
MQTSLIQLSEIQMNGEKKDEKRAEKQKRM